MKLRSLRVETSPRLMIIPMIDIIFFLLVFFMLSTLFMVEQRALPVNLPPAAAGQAEMAERVPITIFADGRIMIAREEVPADLVKPRIRAELSRRPDTAFVLRADRRAEYGTVVTVLDELKSMGVQRVAVATDPPAR